MQVGVVADGQQLAWQVQIPGRFDQLPAALGLLGQRGSFCLFKEPVHLIGESDSATVRALVEEEPLVDFHAVEHVEGVDDVLEPQPAGGLDQVVFAELAGVVGPARVQELAALRCALPIYRPKVSTDVTGERNGQFVEGDPLPLLGAQLQQRLAQGELVRGDVSAEQDQRPPVESSDGRSSVNCSIAVRCVTQTV